MKTPYTPSSFFYGFVVTGFYSDGEPLVRLKEVHVDSSGELSGYADPVIDTPAELERAERDVAKRDGHVFYDFVARVVRVASVG